MSEELKTLKDMEIINFHRDKKELRAIIETGVPHLDKDLKKYPENKSVPFIDLRETKQEAVKRYKQYEKERDQTSKEELHYWSLSGRLFVLKDFFNITKEDLK